jgi:hypothetical protein
MTERDIVNEVFYWKKRLHIPKFYFSFDNRMKWCGFADYNRKLKAATLVLNSKEIFKWEPILQGLIFHEFGHILQQSYKHYYTIKDQIRQEYLAEKFALKTLKKYCPEVYKDFYNHYWEELPLWKKSKPIYYKAFRKLYENK